MFLTLLFFGMYLIDQPDIVFLNHGDYTVQLRFGPVGEIIGYTHIGLWDRFSFGVSYGASNLIGAGNPEFYGQPGIQARVLLIEQSLMIPAIIVGFDNQGYGKYDSARYDIMSKGLYVQIGETFAYPGLKIAPNLGINYSFEQEHRFDMFAGIRFGIGSTNIIIDYSPNFFDDKDQNKGYLNTGIRLVFYEQLFFEFALRDMLDNSNRAQQLNRMIKIGYRANL
ncbi:MAG: hypothetical protein ACUVQT_02220 [bacterium]